MVCPPGPTRAQASFLSLILASLKFLYYPTEFSSAFSAEFFAFPVEFRRGVAILHHAVPVIAVK
jgi:hypothetical protein